MQRSYTSTRETTHMGQLQLWCSQTFATSVVLSAMVSWWLRLQKMIEGKNKIDKGRTIWNKDESDIGHSTPKVIVMIMAPWQNNNNKIKINKKISPFREATKD